MKIALCSKGKFSLEKGFTKNRIELAESLQKLGWETLLVDKQEIGIPAGQKYNATNYNLALRDYLKKNSELFDVVLYEYDTLPFDRNLFSKKTLFVARPAILAYHFPLIKFRYNFRARVANFINSIKHTWQGKAGEAAAYEKQISYSLSQADVIQVQNAKDRALLMSRGYSSDKIVIVPNGITSERITLFDAAERRYQEPYTIAFVGTFDFRKGAMDFPVFFSKLIKRFPTIKLKLLGTWGLFPDVAQVLNFFPKSQHASIQVIPKFKSEELPQLLSDCHVGVFPSYLESFGFGALEMMCAGLPVVAYDCPGPSDFILPELLTPTGNATAIADKIIALMENKELLKQKGREARAQVISTYCWDDIAVQVDRNYRVYLAKLRQQTVPEQEQLVSVS